MKLKGIGIRNNETGLAVVYIPEIHSLVNTNIKQDEKIKDGYLLNSSITESELVLIKEKLNNAFNLLEDRSLSILPHLGFCVITNECNMGCSFCFADKNSIYGDLFDINWIKILKETLPQTSFGRVNISGGEPLLYFDKVKDIQIELGKIRIYTNGSLITDEVAKWAIETDTLFHIALDYTIKDFDGHNSYDIRERLQEICDRNIGFKDLLEIAITYPSDKIDKFNIFREEQKKTFENNLEHEINYISGDTSYLTFETFNEELEMVESGKILLKDSIFNRQVRYVERTINNYINVESCSPNITLNFNGDVTSCFVNGSNVTHPLYDKCVISNVKDFTIEKYLSYAKNTKKRGLCKKDCHAKYFCGNICWANIDHNNFNCEITKNSLFHVLYLIMNNVNIDLTNEINYTRIETL
jgi:sulfatase maturation enzyme AslB (radical SAM superfamily)